MAVTLVARLLAAQPVDRLGIAAINRISGFLLCAIAGQFVFDGVARSELRG
jgi:small neutral amino acid transporter SnatA (MarC family)